MDGLHLSGSSQIPALVLLGWWWGRLGRRGQPISGSISVCWPGWAPCCWAHLLALLIRFGWPLDPQLWSWVWHTLWCRNRLGLLAPMLASVQLLLGVGGPHDSAAGSC